MQGITSINTSIAVGKQKRKVSCDAIERKYNHMKKLMIFLLLTFTIAIFGQVEKKQKTSDFLPKDYVIFERINGDLNKDGIEDCVLIIKGTNKDNIVINRFDEEADRNRRGVIVLLNNNDHYELVVKNYDCFSSENEDGGVYFPPELSVSIKNGKLYFHYAHGRYGYWKYTFRFQNSDMELIGYDAAYRSRLEFDCVTFDETSVNFLSKKKLEKELVRIDDDGKNIFKETWKNITVNELVKLSEIKDFDELDRSIY